MGRNLYVGNLPHSANNQTLQDMFSPCGTVESVNVIMDRATSQNKGFAFVEMSNDKEAQKAIRDTQWFQASTAGKSKSTKLSRRSRGATADGQRLRWWRPRRYGGYDGGGHGSHRGYGGGGPWQSLSELVVGGVGGVWVWLRRKPAEERGLNLRLGRI